MFEKASLVFGAREKNLPILHCSICRGSQRLGTLAWVNKGSDSQQQGMH